MWPNSGRRWSLYACAHSTRAVWKQKKWQLTVTHNRKIVLRWHTKPYINNNNNIGWLFFEGYKNILPSILTVLPSSSTWPILLASWALYSYIPLKAIQYHIHIVTSLNYKFASRGCMKWNTSSLIMIHIYPYKWDYKTRLEVGVGSLIPLVSQRTLYYCKSKRLPLITQTPVIHGNIILNMNLRRS